MIIWLKGVTWQEESLMGVKLENLTNIWHFLDIWTIYCVHWKIKQGFYCNESSRSCRHTARWWRCIAILFCRIPTQDCKCLQFSVRFACHYSSSIEWSAARSWCWNQTEAWGSPLHQMSYWATPIYHSSCYLTLIPYKPIKTYDNIKIFISFWNQSTWMSYRRTETLQILGF